MKVRLDVHTIHSDDTPQAWKEQCVQSVLEAAKQAGYPVNIWNVMGEAGHIGNGRAHGFSKGSYGYVTFVDDDDFVAPNAFACLAPALALRPRLVFTREQLLQNDRDAGIGSGHHLAVMRRKDAVAHDWAKHPSGGEAELYATLGPPVQLADVVYTHRLYRSKGRALRGLHHG